MPSPQEETNHVITAASTDAQINAKATRIAYSTGTHAWILCQLFSLQREVARMKAGNVPPHLQDVERR